LRKIISTKSKCWTNCMERRLFSGLCLWSFQESRKNHSCQCEIIPFKKSRSINRVPGWHLLHFKSRSGERYFNLWPRPQDICD